MMHKNQLMAGLILLFIFLLGAVSGSVATRLFEKAVAQQGTHDKLLSNSATRAAPRPPRDFGPPPPLASSAEEDFPLPGAGRGNRLLRKLERELDLRPSQKQALANEIKETEEAFRALHEETRTQAIALALSFPEKLRPHLEPEQQQKFDAHIAGNPRSFLSPPPRGEGPPRPGLHQPQGPWREAARERLRAHLLRRLQELEESAPSENPEEK
jgi:hypothetical protein